MDVSVCVSCIHVPHPRVKKTQRRYGLRLGFSKGLNLGLWGFRGLGFRSLGFWGLGFFVKDLGTFFCLLVQYLLTSSISQGNKRFNFQIATKVSLSSILGK